LKRTAQLIVVFLAGAASGLALERSLVVHHPAVVREQRFKGSYRLINPLLECDVAGDTLQSEELKPFEDSVARLVQQRTEEGAATSVSVYFRDLDTGAAFSINGDTRYSPASLSKIPVLIACLKRAETHPGFLAERYRFDGASDWNEVQNLKPEQVLTPGSWYSVDELLRRMAGYSDNNAWALLFQRFSTAELDAIMHDLGVEFAEGAEDIVTVNSYGRFLRILYNASYLSKGMSEKALEYLTLEDFPQGLAAGVPKGLTIADKFGERSSEGGRVKQLHNYGIVYYPGRPYLLCVMTRGRDFARLTGVISEISRAVYARVDSQLAAHGGSR
jgi:beta-lactamase class A